MVHKGLKRRALQITNPFASGMLSFLNASNLQTVLSKSPVFGERTSTMNSTRNEADKTVDIFVLERNPYVLCDSLSKSMSVLDTFLWCSLSPVLNPYAIDDGVEHFPPVFFSHADRIEENITRPCTNRLMGFNPSKSSVLVPSVTKASYQQPLEGILLLIKRVSFACNLAF